MRRTGVQAALGTLVAVLAAMVAVQYGRERWPFPAERAQGHDHGAPTTARSPTADALPAGYAAVMVDPAKAAAIGLATAVIDQREFTRTVRTVGVVTLDETRTAHVHARVRGSIEDIRVDFVGRKVKAGDVLCTIYSQEVLAAEVELVSLLGRSSAAVADPLLDAARRRLALWDVPAGEIERLERTREPARTFPLLAPRGGTVIAKSAIAGSFVDPSVELYTLSDLSHVWVLADLYDADVPYVRVGATARLTVEGTDRPFESVVAFLAPTLDEATRTRKVRFEVANPGGTLLPGAFATVELDLALGEGLAVPTDAVIRTGARSIVFIAHGDSGQHLEPREVVLGPLVGDHVRVERGLARGDRVATGAQFLLDSESRLQATSGPSGDHVH